MNKTLSSKCKNIAMTHDESAIYGNVDGLSLQNLFYVKNGFFPSCYMFDYESRTNGDYIFDTKKMLNYLVENISDDEEMEISPYYTKILGSDEKDPRLGFCVILKKSNLFARFEKSVTESYILFDNSHIDDLNTFVDKILQFYIAPKAEENNIWRLCFNNGNYFLEKGKIKAINDFNVKKLYNDGFEKEDTIINNFLKEEDRSGLIILHGEKGTGKTSYIKHLVSSFPDRKFVFVPSNMISLLGEPAFGTFLTTLNNHVIILEDCENAIRDRKTSGSASAVSLLLNMTDGLLSDDLSMKFICTFNDKMDNIDPALLRKGRLVSKYEFRPLSVEKTKEILNDRGFNTDEIDKPMTLADIFHYEEIGYETSRNKII